MKSIVVSLYKRQRYANRQQSRNDINEHLDWITATKSIFNKSYELQKTNNMKMSFCVEFSYDGNYVATSHGHDHSVKVSNCYTLKMCYNLLGHPRTPWCISFHPRITFLLASGCLGGEVRLWNLDKPLVDTLLFSSENSISSLSFHPFDDVLVVSTLNKIIFYDWNQRQTLKVITTDNKLETVQYVKFLPDGRNLITAITNILSTANENVTVNYMARDVSSSSSVFYDDLTQHGLYGRNHHQLQIWKSAHSEFPHINRESLLIPCDCLDDINLVGHCKIINQSSCTVAADGTLIGLFICSQIHTSNDLTLKVISLKAHNYLQCIYSRKYGCNAVSISLSPTNRYVIVGLSSQNMHWSLTTHQLMGQILKLPRDSSSEIPDESKAMLNILHQSKKGETRGATVSSNYVRFHPLPGMGVIYGTNRGHVRHCQVVPITTTS